jgi:predicted HTH transcriptional regulator
MIAEMSDQDLLARMKNFEDHFVERKTCGDSRDWLKTVVAFANSAPIGYPCILYIGVRDNGEIEARQTNFDSLQKTLNKFLQDAYPRVAYLPRIITEGGKQALAVIVPGSDSRPHFAGPAYVRRGSETFEASDEQLDDLIASRSGKVYRISLYIGKPVTTLNCNILGNGQVTRSKWIPDPFVFSCNEFWVTLQMPAPSKGLHSFMLKDVDLNYDNQSERLQLEITNREF